MSDAPISVTKLEAAKWQLRTAIRLWFADGDPVSTHTLAAAAHEIIHTLFRRSGLRGLLFDSPLIREEYRDTLAKAIKQRATFFKHAQRDPEGEMAFDPVLNDTLLIVSISGLSRMKEPLETEEQAFITWLRLHEPRYFAGDVVVENLPAETLEGLRTIGKQEFFEASQEMFREPRRMRLH